MESNEIVEFKELNKIVDEVFGISILSRRKPREAVDARMVFSKILLEKGYSYSAIARYLKRDHTTILHYMKNFETLIYQLQPLRHNLEVCRASFMENREPEYLTDGERLLKKSIDGLKDMVKKLHEENEKLMKLQNKYNRIGSIINIIDERTPKGKESFIKNKINQMFNGLYEDEDE